tara:strand:+ start:6619 stop:7458 length:840 start_codon:yes stop_codon:yes gene_type:complete
MKRGLVGCFILFLFVISFVGAEVSEIHIKTIPYHEVQISPYRANSASFSIIEQFIGTSNQYGDVYWDFDTDEDEFNVVVFIKNLAHERVTSKKYKDEFEAGEPVYIELASKDFEFIYSPEDLVIGEETIGEINETDGNESSDGEEVIGDVGEEELGSEEENATTTITGGAIGDGGFLSMKSLYWIVGGIVGLIIIFLIVLFIAKKKKGGNKEIKVKKLSELKAERKGEAKMSEELKDAEEELRDAQAKINAINNKDKIDSLQEELEQKQRELMALKGGS